MQNLTEWFNALATLEKIYWLIAFPSSLLFIIQTITAFFGGDTDDVPDADLEIEADTGFGFHFLTFRNLVAFFTVMSWTGLACLDSGYSNTVSIIISITAGLAMMVSMAYLMYFLFKLRESGTVKLENAIGKTGEAYLRVPAKKAGYGKIQISLQGSTHEFNAVNAGDEEIPTGAIIEVVEILNGNILLVKPA